MAALSAALASSSAFFFAASAAFFTSSACFASSNALAAFAASAAAFASCASRSSLATSTKPDLTMSNAWVMSVVHAASDAAVDSPATLFRATGKAS